MTVTIPRRKLITLLGSAAVVWPRAVGAQQKKLPRIGALVLGNADADCFGRNYRKDCGAPATSKGKTCCSSSDRPKESWNDFLGLLQSWLRLRSMSSSRFTLPAPSQHSVLPVRFRLSFWRATRLKPALSVALLARAAISPAYLWWQQNCMANASNCSATCCRPFAGWLL
jgi:hypothetical protein